MPAKIVITITEDDAPDGHVAVDWDIEGCDISDMQRNSELPPALLLGAEMIKLVDDLPSVGGEPVPSKSATADRMVP